MKRKNFKPMIISALLATGFGATSVGTSFALFTDKASTSISVTAGVVDVNSTITIESVASLNATDVGNSIADGKLSASLSQGGTVAIANGVVSINKMIPGDKVVLKMENKNNSNVLIKHRITSSVSSFVFDEDNEKVADTSNKKLGDKLTVKFFTDENLTTEVTNYEKWSTPVNAQTLSTYYIEVAFPDGDNGTIKFGTENNDNVYQNKAADFAFSLEAVQGNAVTENKTYLFNDSYVEGKGANAHYVHEITNAAQFKNILTHIAKNGSTSVNGVALANEKTVYLLKNDIDFNNAKRYANEAELTASDVVFTGILDGDGHAIKNTVIDAFNKDRAGLFRDCKSAEFKNFTLSNVTTLNEAGKIALITSGIGEDAAQVNDYEYIKFKNIVVDNSCSVKATGSSAAAFCALGRSLYELSFDTCTNYANISSTAYSVGGFTGSATSVRGGENKNPNLGTLKFINCANYGNITTTTSGSGGMAAGFAGQCHGQGYYVLKDCYNYGNITSGGETASPFLAGNSANFATYMNTEGKMDISNISNSGLIKKAKLNDTMVDTHSFGLHKAGSDNSVILDSNGQTQSYDNFFANYVIENSVVLLDVSGTGTQFTNNKFTVNLENLPAGVTNYSVRKLVSVMNIDYDANTGSGSNSGSKNVVNQNVNITTLGDSLEVSRLMYIGNTYTNKGEPLVTYTGIETHQQEFVYHFDKYLVDGNNTWAVGYHELDNGASYFIHDNTNVTSGVYNLTHNSPSCVFYEVSFFAGENLVATTGLVSDFWIGSGSGMLNVREIPSGTSIAD